MKFAADHNLAIGFMVWVGPHSPEWLYSNGVPKVTSQTVKRSGEFILIILIKHTRTDIII
jgi:hypothetical protein